MRVLTMLRGPVALPQCVFGFNLADTVVCCCLLQVKNFKTYVKREIVHQSSLKHPFIVSLKEVIH